MIIYGGKTSNEKTCISKIKSFISKHPIIFYGIIAGIVILIVVIIVLCVVLTKKNEEKEEEKEEEKNETEIKSIFPLEASLKNEVMDIYNNLITKNGDTYQAFCNYLAETASNLKDEQKVYLVYYWIINNIDYDHDGLAKGTASIVPSVVFQKTLTICSGYSALFRDLLLATNYPSNKIKNIVGYSKGAGYTIFSLPTINHEWNAVEINGEWCLIDTTWDANTFTEYYLCTPPKCFARDHLPGYDNSLQFLDNPLTLEKFHSLIDQSINFCNNGIEVIEDKAIQNICGEGKVIFKYNPKYIQEDYIQFFVFPSGKKMPEYFINHIDNGFEILLYINENGTYAIYLSMNGYGMGDIIFNCEEEPLTKKYYPILGLYYTFEDIKLITPMERDLTKGQKYNFELKSNDHKQLLIKMDDEYINMTKIGNIFKEDNIYIHSDNIIIKNEDNDELVRFKGIGNNVNYPKVFTIIQSFKINVRLINPSTKILNKGQTYEFKIRNYSDGTLYISLGTQRIKIDKDSNNICTKTLQIEESLTSSVLNIIYEAEYLTTLYEFELL